MSRDVVIRADAMQQIDDHLRAASPIDAGGLLVGMASQRGDLVVVTAAVTAIDLLSASRLSEQDFADLGERAADLHPHQRVVGWFRSHPAGEVTLSGDELELQRTIFSHPWQILYVSDPIDGERGLFGWSDGEIARVPSWHITSIVEATNLDLPVAALVPVVDESAEEVPEMFDDEPLADEPEALDDSDPLAGDYVDNGSPPLIESEQPELAPVAASSAVVASTARPIGKRSSNGRWVALAVAAVVAIAVIAIIVNAAGDDNNSTSPTSPTSQSTTNTSETSTTSGQVTTTSQATTGTEGPLPATPTTVTTPATRVGSSLCEPSSANTYEPLGDCFVPLVNGNILVFKAGSLLCTEPSGFVVAGEAQSFTVGVDGDPLAVTADGTLVQKCADLTYAKNVMAAGSTTLDGLCGSSGTQINEATARCFGQNGSTGAMVAMVRGTSVATKLVGTCYSASTTDPARFDLTWSDPAVDTTWRVDSVLQGSDQQFTATASKAGVSATATFACS